MKRRDLILGASALAATAQSTHTAKSASHRKKTFVLVHGAWHGGWCWCWCWCWRYVRELLITAGHLVFSPSLTGLGDRVHLRSPDVNLSTHATDIVNLIEYEELQDVILVGHSYAGHVVSLVADRIKQRIKHIAFLDAVLAIKGKPFLEPKTSKVLRANAIDGYLIPYAEKNFFGIPADHPLFNWAKRRIVEHPLPTLTETVVYQNGGPSRLPKTYVRCTENPIVKGDMPDPVLDLIALDSEWTYMTLNTGHDLMVTALEETAEIILNII